MKLVSFSLSFVLIFMFSFMVSGFVSFFFYKMTQAPVTAVCAFGVILAMAAAYFAICRRSFRKMKSGLRLLTKDEANDVLRKVLPSLGDVVMDTDDEIVLEYKGIRLSFVIDNSQLTVYDPGWYRIRRNDPKLLAVYRAMNSLNVNNKVMLTMDIAPRDDGFYYLNTILREFTFSHVPMLERYLEKMLDVMIDKRKKMQEALKAIDALPAFSRPMGFATETPQPVNA